MEFAAATGSQRIHWEMCVFGVKFVIGSTEHTPRSADSFIRILIRDFVSRCEDVVIPRHWRADHGLRVLSTQMVLLIQAPVGRLGQQGKPVKEEEWSSTDKPPSSTSKSVSPLH
jgi:hypothetical protein